MRIILTEEEVQSEKINNIVQKNNQVKTLILFLKNIGPFYHKIMNAANAFSQ